MKNGPPIKKRAVEAGVDQKIQEFLEQNYLVSFAYDYLRFWNGLKHLRKQGDDFCCKFLFFIYGTTICNR